MNPTPYNQLSRTIYLISGHNAGTLNHQEQKELDHWRCASETNQELFNQLTDKAYQRQELAAMSIADTDAAYERISSRLRKHRPNYIKTLAIAAAVLFAVSALIKYALKDPVTTDQPTVQVIHDVAPGSNKATLTLAGGKTISLSDAGNATLANLQGTRITNSSGLVSYTDQPNAGNTNSNTTNEIKTPNGGIYTLMLADGSKVTLNAASRLRFPTSFAGNATRIVELQGEAFFEVSKDKQHPFIVKTTQQQVKVLGTRFNLNSYRDEPQTKTTLIEGKVSINNLAVLKPGEQGISSGESLTVRKVDTRPVIAWYNGQMDYNNVDLATIMREISRWYDIEIVYPNGIPDKAYTGSIERSSSLSAVLEMFRISGMKFRMEQTPKGKRLIVNL